MYGPSFWLSKAVLFFQRIGDTMKLKNKGLIISSARLKEIMSAHYLEGRFVKGKRKVAWATSGAPVEPLRALGFFIIYPENHGAVCGARKVSGEIIKEAEKFGFSQDICSYARTDIGYLISGKTPVGYLSPPDMVVACTNICQTVLYWFEFIAHRFKVPLVVIDTPYLLDGAYEHYLEYTKKQIVEMIHTGEKICGRDFSEKKLVEIVRISKETTQMWMNVLKSAINKPSPISAFDTFMHMAPIVNLRGEKVALNYYRRLLKEINKRVEKKIPAIKNEKHRALWDNLPIWFKLRELASFLAERDVNIVISTYTYAWGELVEIIDETQPLDSLAKVYLHPILNRSPYSKFKVIKKLIKEFSIDCVIFHSDRSCKPYSVGQMDERKKVVDELGIPAVIIESDHNDPRGYTDAQVKSRLEALIEMLS